MKKYMTTNCLECNEIVAQNSYCFHCGKRVPKTDSREVAEREAFTCPSCKQSVLAGVYCCSCGKELKPVVDDFMAEPPKRSKKKHIDGMPELPDIPDLPAIDF
jgi:hypothetical protein